MNKGCDDCGAVLIPCKNCGHPVRIERIDVYHAGKCPSCGVDQDEVCPTRTAMSEAEERTAREQMIDRSNSLIK